MHLRIPYTVYRRTHICLYIFAALAPNGVSCVLRLAIFINVHIIFPMYTREHAMRDIVSRNHFAKICVTSLFFIFTGHVAERALRVVQYYTIQYEY